MLSSWTLSTSVTCHHYQLSANGDKAYIFYGPARFVSDESKRVANLSFARETIQQKSLPAVAVYFALLTYISMGILPMNGANSVLITVLGIAQPSLPECVGNLRMNLPQPVGPNFSSGPCLLRSAISGCARICTFPSRRVKASLNTGDSADYSECNALHHDALTCVLVFVRAGQTARIRTCTKLRSRSKCPLVPVNIVFSSMSALASTCFHPCQVRVPESCLFSIKIGYKLTS